MDTSTTSRSVKEIKENEKPSRWLCAVGQADRVLAIITEIPAAFLVLMEILVLFTGVVSRYVIHSPITWSDELASLMF